MALTQQQQREIAALVAGYTAMQANIEARLLEQIRWLFSRLLPGWWWRHDQERFVRATLIEYVSTAQDALADLTGSYLDSVFDVMDIRIPRKDRNKRISLPDQLRDVERLIEWGRPARDARVIQLKGTDAFEANEIALWRAERQALMDLQLAAREAEKQKYGLAPDDQIYGWRRVTRPERSKHGPCGLCVVAATRVYGKSVLRPLHNGCVCTTLPVTDSADPGLDLNREDFEIWSSGKDGDVDKELKKINLTREDLDAYYKQAGGTGRSGLQRLRSHTIQHGELGPVLVNPKYRNRGPDETRSLRDNTKWSPDPERMWKVQDDLVKQFEAMLRSGNNDVRGPLEYHRRMRRTWDQKRRSAA